MAGLNYIGSLALPIICPANFSALASVGIDLGIKLSGLFSLSITLGITLPFPELSFLAALTLPDLIAQFTAAIDLSPILLPSFNAELAIQIGAQLAIVEAIILVIQPLIAVAEAGIEVYAYAGPGGNLGSSLTSQLASGWGDGTPALDTVEAIIFGATTTVTDGIYTADQVVSASLLPPATPTPAPPPPPPTPTPMYSRGMTHATFTAPTGMGGTTATASVTVVGGAVTGLTMTDHGSGYTSPPSITIADSTAVLDASNTSPIVITVAPGATLDVMSVTIAGVLGNTAANGQACAKVLTTSTFALYMDGGFTMPIAGNGAYVSGGTITGSGFGAVATPSMGGGSAAAATNFFNGIEFGTGLQYGGSVELQAMCGAAFSFLIEIYGQLQLQAGQLGIEVKACLDLPPLPTATLELLGQIAATVKIALNADLKIPMPSISAAFLASISAQLSAVEALFAQLSLQLAFAGVTLEVYSYSGPGSGLGPAVTTALSSGWGDRTPPSAPVSAIVLGATSSAASTAFSVFFAGAA